MSQTVPRRVASEAGVKREAGPIARDGGATAPALHFYAVTPATRPRAMVAIVHGYGEYGERYDHVMTRWAEKEIASVAVDLRGHGRAQGRRGYCDRFDEYVDDASDFARLVHGRAAGAPTFLFGHSFGGLVATSLALRDASPWKGLLLSAPYFGRALDVPAVKILAGRLASKLLPTFALPTGFHGADVTRDATRAKAHDADPLCFEIATARWFTEAEAGQARALASARSLSLPLILVMGTADRIAKLQTARQFFDSVGSTDKTLDVRAGFFHEVLNEPEWESIADLYADWVLARSGAGQ